MRLKWILTSIACFALAGSPALPREDRYLLEGEVVPRNVYDAAMTYNESVVLIRQHLEERAMGKLRRALLLNPEMSEAHTNLGVLLARQGKEKEAVDHLLTAMKSKKVKPGTYLVLATLYQSTGSVDKAIETYQNYLERFADDEDFRKAAEGSIALLKEEQNIRKKAGKTAQQRADYYTSGTATGFRRWTESRMPVHVYLEQPSDVEGYTEVWGDILKNSFYDWSAATGKKVRFVFVDDPDQAEIRCYWTNDPSLLGNGSEAGETKTRSLGQAIVQADIHLRAKEDEGGFPFTDHYVQGTCLHEIGHALGIGGHSPLPDDVMFFSTSLSDNPRTLTKRDRATLAKIYNQGMELHWQVLDFLVNPRMWSTWGVAASLLTIVLAPLGLLATRKKKRKKRKK